MAGAMQAAPLGLPALSSAVNPLNIPGDYFHPAWTVKPAAHGSTRNSTRSDAEGPAGQPTAERQVA